MRTMKRSLYLALGTNMGDRASNMETALALLEERFGPRSGMSEVIETEAVGFDGLPFLNCIAVFLCSDSPSEVLAACKAIEKRMGRNDSPEYAADGSRIYHDRVMDIDILMYGDICVDTPELTIPHPQIESRAYIKELLLNL